MTEQPKVYKVAEITRLIKRSLEGEFRDLWIEGEASNLRMPKSGHAYFTVKDESAQIQAVRFRADSDPVFRELKDGDKVRVYGSVSVYEKSGQYQIYVQALERAGLGDLQKRFQELKEKLEKEGLFDRSRKKPMPLLPQRIGIVTSPTGAAIRDMLNVLERRFSNVHVILVPVKVQGEGAAAEIAAGIDLLNAMNEVDVIIAGRGGGSLEDLFAFNEEEVARAVFRSRIPVISAVGHEIDYTISDFTADLRAETPTAAAELVLKKKEDFITTLEGYKEKMVRSVAYALRDCRARVERCADHYALKEPQNVLQQYRQRVDEIGWKVSQIFSRRKEQAESLLNKEKEKLMALNPLGILARGYSVTQDLRTKKIIKDVKALKKGTELRTLLHRGEIISTVENLIAAGIKGADASSEKEDL